MPDTTLLHAGSMHSCRVFRWRRQIGLLIFLPLVLAAVLSGRYWSEGSTMDDVLDAAGFALLVGGVALRSWATLYIGGRKNHQLITSGPYGLSRNPLYLGSLLIGLGVAVLLQSLTLGLAALVLGPVLYSRVVREEERVLLAEYGEEYRAYLRRVPRLLPRRWRAAPAGSELLINLTALRRHALRSSLTLLLIPAGELVARLQSQGVLPKVLGLP
jgi:protein-S-isoprenylcysteine O-methyltransferase Ste14